jgi:two-component system OmpR family sensor kinase
MRAGSGWSLRKRLVVGILALLAVFSVVVGSVSVAALHQFLVSKVDEQLTAASWRSQDVAGRPDGHDGPVQMMLPGLGAGALGVLVLDGTVVQSGYISAAGEAVPLDADQLTRLTALDVDGSPVTVDLGDLGAYRVVARTDDGASSIVGLPLADVQDITGNLLLIVAVVAGLALAAAGIASTLAVRRALRPLERVAATAGRVAELPLARGEVALVERVPVEYANSKNEVGKVASSLNRMLDHVASALTARQTSEDKVRQFVADASHELRTPLAAIRGYSELTRRSPHELPGDVRHSLARIESESLRMTRLVEDLLLLARLDEGQELRDEDVDVSTLLVDVTSDARAAGPEHIWKVAVPEEPVFVVGETERLHQAVANLLANARAHTPPGTVVSVALRAEADSCVISVTDDGPGISPDLLPTLFERFVRGDSSRSRRAGSTGLGLAIVRGILESHGGTVDVESEAGRTVFTVRLPSVGAAPAGRRQNVVPQDVLAPA